MKKISLNDLPRYSPWPDRLLGLSDFKRPHRSIEKIDAEYDKDKYAKCLEFIDGSTEPQSPEQVKLFEFRVPRNSDICVSIGEDLFLTTLADARKRYYSLLVDSMADAIEVSDCVLELGCGYGFNLWVLKQAFPEKNFYGGEYSTNAVRIAERLFSGDPSIVVGGFNYYDQEYDFASLTGSIVVFTSHSIEQLPTALHAIEAISRVQGVRSVFHFEPVAELYSDTMLGYLRKSYAAANDYNRDLLDSVCCAGGVVGRTTADVFGMNPLNPTSIIQWSPSKT